MAAGLGSRLMPLTENIPKPMVPVLNKPVMQYCIELLKEHGVQEIIANTHYRPEAISNYFGDGSNLGVRLEYSYEEELLGTAGGVKNNRWFLDETFIIVSGDALTDINLTEMARFHKENNALVTLALKSVEDVSKYGVVVTDEAGKIQAFQEKPKASEAVSNLVNTGIYIFEPEIFDYIPDGFYDFGKELFPKLVEMNAKIYGFNTTDYWSDVGSLEVYKDSNWDFLANDKNLIGKNTVVQDSAKQEGNVVIGSGCYIGNNVRLKNCIIWDDCIIADNVVIENAIIGSKCLIGEGSTINSQVVVGCGCKIGSNVTLGPGLKIESNSRIDSGEDILEVG
ncbi:mannose-1-phosphate guanylyltransferase [Desulfonispora thiosulfatigenes DSM 11270]|uniref:Mannose-1-phosphate guanylyltransferase n=2 Tax=Desulfonispora thiosulfatigenes TaxID=83661 RepID=A0A1W1V5V1_DESTI|nr:mannose-1-phosphate guanylyltransferase [Desulfonispora thiosulfatigenes DSM 11270]